MSAIHEVVDLRRRDVSVVACGVLGSNEGGEEEQSGIDGIARKADEVGDGKVGRETGSRAAADVDEYLGVEGYGPEDEVGPAEESKGESVRYQEWYTNGS